MLCPEIQVLYFYMLTEAETARGLRYVLFNRNMTLRMSYLCASLTLILLTWRNGELLIMPAWDLTLVFKWLKRYRSPTSSLDVGL
jgi:hypothetical protein